MKKEGNRKKHNRLVKQKKVRNQNAKDARRKRLKEVFEKSQAAKSAEEE